MQIPLSIVSGLYTAPRASNGRNIEMEIGHGEKIAPNTVKVYAGSQTSDGRNEETGISSG